MQVVKILANLCLFQAKPQDLPASQILLAVTGIAAVVSYALTLQPSQAAITQSLQQVLHRPVSMYALAIAVTVAFGATIWLTLRLRTKTERFLQTASAIFGAMALIRLLMWPFSIWSVRSADGSTSQQATGLIVVVLATWMLAVIAYILKEALEIDYLVGALYTLGMFVFALLMSFFVIGLLP